MVTVDGAGPGREGSWVDFVNPQRFIPSMFHRRLVLLMVVCVVLILGMSGQMVRLSVVESADRRASAESKLEERTFLPTTRGRILDRKDRVLALDKASSDIAVEYDVITGVWPRDQAVSQTKKEVGRARWSAMSPEERQKAVSAHVPEWQAKVDRMWAEVCRVGGISPSELQKRIDRIKQDVQNKAADIWARQLKEEREKYGIPEDEDYDDFKARPIREQVMPHVILPRVSDDIAYAFKRFDQQNPGMLEVIDSRKREYPWSGADVRLSRNSLPRPIRNDAPVSIRVTGVADHILGAMRDEVWAEDVERRPFLNSKTLKVADLGGYREGDVVGSRGIEKVFEDTLRGLRGQVNTRKDTGLKNRIEPAPGKDLQLTIDIMLQARIQAIMTPEYGLAKVQPWQHNEGKDLPPGTPLNAAAVVLDVQTGEILAMVSMPTFAMGQMMSPEQQKIDQPVVNRAVEAVYPPGSIIKPLVLSAAVTEGVHNLDSSITCTGHYFENNLKIARCWIFRDKYGMVGHGPLQAAEALARSCNMFFFTLADRLGMERLCNWYRRFGLGGVLDIGLSYESKGDDGKVTVVGESAGDVPGEKEFAAMKAKGEGKFSQIIMGIGQGPVTWTPLQAANAFATLARGGVIRDATLLMSDPRGTRPQRAADLHLSKHLVDVALEGLRESVMERFGTGNHFGYDDKSEEVIINAQGVQVWAKTGTAQSDVKKLRDHSWFVGLVGPKDATRPMQAIAVIVENGGSGGRTAGPIANQIIRALQAEGYLPGDANAPVVDKNHPASSEPEPEPSDERQEDH